ncbi:MAG TPA: hypothetical protein PLL78_02695 [Fimbriimonadaceae bacterium]|nr:hypothetical protein [Fimbriimonadaceae bacterium]HRJ95568.1 hypothetical protein [Fimbriimonadaceae bacterium]
MKWFGLVLLFGSAFAQAQVGPGFFDNIRARQLGPTTMGGRITDLAVYEKEPRIFYVASASGGLWKTTNGGLTMTCVFERENSISLGACAVGQKDPNLVWVGTGEATSRNSVAWGDGVYKSTDGGKNWEHMGLTATRHISKVIIDPTNPDVVYVAAMGELWGYNEDRGVYKTTDGGKTWAKVLYVDDKTGIADLRMDPKNPKVLMAAAWQKLRKAYDFTSGGPGSAMYKSTDGGKTWRKITRGLPTTSLGRIGLTYHKQDPRVMMAMVEYSLPQRPAGEAAPASQPGQPAQPGQQARRRGSGTFRSTDGGESWKEVNALNPRPFYFSVVEIDPTDSQRAYVLGVDLSVTTNGGERFQTLNLRVHSDWHALWINPADPYHIIAGTDGGVYQSRDRGERWEHIDSLPLGQFYCATYDMRKPYWVYGGLQDNLCWAFPTQTIRGGAIASDAYTVNASGDGFHVVVDPNDWTTVYAEAQGGSLTRMDQRNGTSRGIRPGANNTTPRLAQGERWRFNWSAPIFLSPHNSRTIYFGGNKLFKSINRGDNWRVISPDLTTNDPTKQRPGARSVTPEDTGAERHCTIITISESPRRQGLLYVGTDDGQVQVSMDDGGSWTNLTRNIPDLPLNTWCSRVIASKWEEGRVYATFDGHRNNDYRPYAYVSEDYGKTWTRITDGLPDYDCLYVIREGEQNPNLLYLGSEMSLRFSLDRGKTWVRYRGVGFPTVAIHDVQVHPRELDLVIGTHGRSIWILPVAALEQLTAEALAADAFVCRPQNVWMMGRSTSGGAGWNGDRGFTSPNTQPGTSVYYHLKQDAKDEVRIVITDILGQEIASLRGPRSAGLQAVVWNLRGRRLAAGDYRVTLTVDGKDYISAVKVEDLVAMGDVKEGIGLPAGDQGMDDGSKEFFAPWPVSR